MTRRRFARIAAASAIALVALVITTALGGWQYTRAHRNDVTQRVMTAPVRELIDVVEPGKYVQEHFFTQRVRVSGTMRPSQALLTCDHAQERIAGCWVIAPVYVREGLAATVVIGWVPADQADATVEAFRGLPDGRVAVQGRLQPAEVIDRGHALVTPSLRVPLININELVLRWDTALLDGYTVMFRPAVGERVQTELVAPPSGITWRNLFYAWQWWLFAAFVIFLLGRYILDVINEDKGA